MMIFLCSLLLLLLSSLLSILAIPVSPIVSTNVRNSGVITASSTQTERGKHHDVCEVCGSTASFDLSPCVTVECQPQLTSHDSYPFAPVEPTDKSPPGTSYTTTTILAADEGDEASVDLLSSFLFQWAKLYQASDLKRPPVEIVVTANVLDKFKTMFPQGSGSVYYAEPKYTSTLKVIPEKITSYSLQLILPDRKKVDFKVGVLKPKGILGKATASVKGLIGGSGNTAPPGTDGSQEEAGAEGASEPPKEEKTPASTPAQSPAPSPAPAPVPAPAHVPAPAPAQNPSLPPPNPYMMGLMMGLMMANKGMPPVSSPNTAPLPLPLPTLPAPVPTPTPTPTPTPQALPSIPPLWMNSMMMSIMAQTAVPTPPVASATEVPEAKTSLLPPAPIPTSDQPAPAPAPAKPTPPPPPKHIQYQAPLMPTLSASAQVSLS